MGRIKTFRNYVLWLILFYVFSIFITYVGLNATYKNINSIDSIPTNIKIDLAQATKVNGRIYGEITSTEENDLNGKYIKIQIYNRKAEIIGVKYLEITDTEKNVPKKFVAYFTSDNVKYYSIGIAENSEEVRKDIIRVRDLYNDVFTDEQLKGITVITLILGLMYI